MKVAQMLPPRVLVLGGASSGKSAFAERLAGLYAKPKTYIATAQAFDAEMRARIDKHRADRGDNWRTIEAPLDLEAAFAQTGAGDIALLDCATLWLSNQLLSEADPITACDAFMAAVVQCPGDLIVVSNEVGQGIVPENALARAFRDAQGRLNQQLAAASDLVVLVAAGLPLVLKGALPEGVA